MARAAREVAVVVLHVVRAEAAVPLVLEEVQIKPKKTDISVSQVCLVWQPWIVRMDGAVEPGA